MPPEILRDLNAEQRAAVTATEGYVRVTAGAGTGKTRALTARCAYLISELGLPAGAVLCVTFTNKAASEMKSRILKLTGSAVPWVTTFHGFCASFLREEAAVLGCPLNFSVLPVPEVKEILKPIYARLGINGRDFSLQDGWEYIDGLKCSDLSYVGKMLAPDSGELLRLAEREDAEARERMFWLYLYQERSAGALDFDDLIAFTLTVLKERPEILRRWQERFQYIQVDEFQDIDPQQYELVKLLSGLYRNLFIVGDPDQTIYTFRGADIAFFADFPVTHPGCGRFAFSRNYRSQDAILRCAHTLISRNPDNGRRRLTAQRRDISLSEMTEPVELRPPGDGLDPAHTLRAVEGHAALDTLADPGFEIVSSPAGSFRPVAAGASSPEEEADFIARQILRIRTLGRMEIAVLYRARHVSPPLERALVRYEVPYRVLGDFNFFERREILDVLAFCRVCINPDDDSALRRIINVPRRGFGKTRLERLILDARGLGAPLFATLRRSLDNVFYTRRTRIRDFADTVARLSAKLTRGLDALEALELILNDFAYERTLRDQGEQERLESLNTLRQLARDFASGAGEDTNLADFIRHLALYVGTGEKVPPGSVSLMTIHNAKGLEFDYVFVAGLNEGTFPSGKSASYADLEEERRLLYVAMTRARRQLFLTSSACGGTRVREGPSRFLEDLRADEIVPVGVLSGGSRRASGPGKCGPAFESGDRVFHKVFVPGKILEVRPASSEYVIRFDELANPRRLAFTAPLEKTCS